MADTITCIGDCIQCSTAQRIYCAAQRCHALLQNQQLILAQLAELREAVGLAKTVTPIDETGTADAGAENRASKKRRTSKKENENEL